MKLAVLAELIFGVDNPTWRARGVAGAGASDVLVAATLLLTVLACVPVGAAGATSSTFSRFCSVSG